MSAKYLLPCSCGNKLTVDTTQAGLKLDCPCGKQVEVPTWRELRSLEKADTPAPVQADGWSTKHGLVFLAMVLAVCSMTGSALVWATTPELEHVHPTDEQVHKAYQTLSLDESMKEWGALKTGPELPEDEHEKMYEAYWAWRMKWVYAGLILTALSLVGALAAGLIPNPPAPA